MLSISRLLTAGMLIRLCLVIYGEWQDRHFQLKFTDVDYHVFTDAANYTLNGYSPYKRETYRYTPLLAWLLVPCHIVHIVYGKMIFVLADLAVAKMIVGILRFQGVKENTIQIALSTWLFNPLIMTVSCRGNAESIVSMSVIGTLYCFLRKKTILAGLLYGFSIHLKIFPVANAFAFFLCLNDLSNTKSAPGRSWKKLYNLMFSRDKLFFFLSTAGFVTVSSAICYALYGFEFLEHAYLYHIVRKDIRHNFSVYFYMLYTNSESWLGLVCFLNQLVVVLFLSRILYRDIIFSNFMIIYAFVTFNKICTSQYFLWYLTILPLIVPGLMHVKLLEIVSAVLFWALAQGLWLSMAYRLEFEGAGVFDHVWYSSVIFFWANVFIMLWLLKRYKQVHVIESKKID